MRKFLLALPLVAASALSAQDAPVTGGFTAGLSIPTGDFASKKDALGDYMGANNGLGMQVGGHLDVALDRHSQFRFHITGYGFASEEQDIYDEGGYFAGTRQNSFSVLQLGGDYIFNGFSPSRGGYFLMGVNLNHVKAKADFSDYLDAEVTQSGRIGARIGGGYHFNRFFSLEGHLNTVAVEKDGNDGLGMSNLTWVAVNAVFRFGR